MLPSYPVSALECFLGPVYTNKFSFENADISFRFCPPSLAYSSKTHRFVNAVESEANKNTYLSY